MTIQEVFGKTTMVIEEGLLLVPELEEVPGGYVTKENVMQEVVDEKQTDWKGSYTVKRK